MSDNNVGPKCDTCPHYSIEREGQTWGKCRAGAPVVEGNRTTWPVVSGPNDWCSLHPLRQIALTEAIQSAVQERVNEMQKDQRIVVPGPGRRPQ